MNPRLPCQRHGGLARLRRKGAVHTERYYGSERVIHIDSRQRPAFPMRYPGLPQQIGDRSMRRAARQRKSFAAPRALDRYATLREVAGGEAPAR